MRRLARATSVLTIALLPATATVIGIVVLTQVPTLTEILGVTLVIAAVALQRDAEPDAERREGRTRAAGGGGPRVAGVDFRLEVGGQPGSASAGSSVRSLT
jgi:inner membrane transporter RhtA